MHRRPVFRSVALVPVLVVLALAGCGKKSTPPAFTAPTPLTHRFFPIATGVHAVDCAACHGNFASFTQFDCTACHVASPTAAVHATTAAYAFASTACLSCHRDPAAHPYDHKPPGTCASCHDVGAFYAALPVAGFTHTPTGVVDCKSCHTPSLWLNVVAPLGVVSDPSASIQVNTLIPIYSGTSIAAVSAQNALLPMGMDHATTEVNTAGLACSKCHTDANAGAFFPGQLHSSLANLTQPAPTACVDCHAGSAPTGFVGPTASNPSRDPSSGEMKHDAVVWSGGAPTGSRLVTADCAACHLSPTANLMATWATGLDGTSPAKFHASLVAANFPQPTSCVDCHANSRPAGPVSSVTATLPQGLTFDHASPAAMGDCAGCHAGATTAWSGGVFHKAGSASPASCLPCHDGQRPTTTVGWTSTTYTASPFDYVANAAGITHGDGQDCAICHAGAGGVQSFAGGKFGHGATTVAAVTCQACHMSQRPDLVLGRAAAAAVLKDQQGRSFDHAMVATGDCIGCHQATATVGSYVNYFDPATGKLPGGDWKGGQGYPGDKLVSASNRFVTVTEVSLVRAAPGALVTGMTSIQDTLYNAMLHTSAQIPAGMSPGPAATPDYTTCWHCHTHDATGAVTNYTDAVFHAAIAAYSNTVGGPPVVPALAQPGKCLDCHAQMRPPNVVERAASDLQPMDHGALFTATVTIAGQTVTGVSGLDCATCHVHPGVSWSDGTFHASIGAAVPADCTACHYPLMADAAKANVRSGALYAMQHRSVQLTFQACATCHTGALAASTTTPYLATAWSPGAYHGSLPAQPTGCVDCHAVSQPAANAPTQSSWGYTLAKGLTGSNSAQWMNHGAAPVVGADCARCHSSDAKPAGSTWSKSIEFHVAVSSPGTCRSCHGLTNGGGAVVGTNNNMPVGLTDSTTMTTASANSLTGVPAGTPDQITHADVNVTGHDCSFCHTQAGRSAVAGIQGVEWAQARFHTSFSAATPLMINGSSGRCSNCHLNVKPAATYTAMDHTALTSTAGTQDCSACHSWPGTGGSASPNWKGATAMPPFITVGGFTIPAPPAPAPITQTGIANLPHPTPTATMTCSTCHTGGTGGKKAIGYDHASVLINPACSACHEAGSDLVGTVWNGSATQSGGAGDTRPFTLTSIVAHKGGAGGDTCTVTAANHFYPIQCGQCHAVPAGTGPVTTGTAYTAAWYFPHKTSNMTNPGTCNKCHTGPSCPK